MGGARVGKGFAPTKHDHLLNLFLDIRVNDSLADDYGADFQAIYRYRRAEFWMAVLTAPGSRPRSSTISAATPLTCGAAMEVPHLRP